jgi:hypothetical protein
MAAVGAQRERAVVIQALVAGPFHRIAHTFNFNLSPKPQPRPFCSSRRQDKLCGGAKPLDEIEHTGMKMYGFDSKLLQRARRDANIITFADGSKRKGRDGKMYAGYSCRLPEETQSKVMIDSPNPQGAFSAF